MQGTPDLFRIPVSLVNKIVVRINVLSPQSFTRPGQNHEWKCLGKSAKPCKRSWLSVTQGRAGAGRVVQRLSEGPRTLQGLSQVTEEGAVDKGGFTPSGWKPGVEGGKLLLTSVISSFLNSRPWDLDAVWLGHSAFVAGVGSALWVLSCSNHTGERAVRETMGLFSLLLNTRPQKDGSSRK